MNVTPPPAGWTREEWLKRSNDIYRRFYAYRYTHPVTIMGVARRIGCASQHVNSFFAGHRKTVPLNAIQAFDKFLTERGF